MGAVWPGPNLCVSCPVAPQSRDAAKIREKLLEHLPHAVLVGLSCRECRQLHDDIRNIADSLLEHSAE